MSLKKYQSKRDIERSKEPAAKVSRHKKEGLHFVVQKHDASRLHYDFRLEVNGVLKSWAVPKGPSLNPADKRLAIMVEDHPYDYKDFEGVIPEGYGAGTVMIWDEGTYQIDNQSPKESEKLLINGLKKGEVHFTLNGSKLQGEFSLVRLRKNEDRQEWLLIKKKDSAASPKIVTDQDRSVVSGRDLDEIAEGKKKAKKAILTVKKKMPHSINPMYATLVDKPFDHSDWLFEIKWDGFRAIAEVDGDVLLYSRYHQPFNQRFPLIVEHLKKITKQAIFDGEIVALDKKGKSHFQALQNIQNTHLVDTQLCYYIFDLLYYDGHDLRAMPLIERKAILKSILAPFANTPIRYNDHIENAGMAFFKLSQDHGLEGMIGKLKNSLYHEGKRTKEWVKIKHHLRQEAIICGFTEPKGGRKNIGALILGVYENKTLRYIGHCGGGFTDKMLQRLKTQFTPFIQKKCPFTHPPKTNTPVTWIKPHYLCEVSFSEWTKEGAMRQPIFIGLREDKSPKEVIREEPKKAKTVIAKMNSKLELTHLDKIYWPNENITKGNLIDYYEKIAPYILPYLKDRPESLHRNPNGIDKPSFFQKDLSKHPQWIQTTKIAHKEKDVNYLLIQDKDSLLYAVNLGCIEINPLLSRIQSLDKPDFVLLDLDPEDIEFDKVVDTALVIHDILENLDIPNYCKTSGATGIHICIPLQAKYSYIQAKQFANIIAELAHQQLPDITSLERSPKKRQKKVYIDYLQNNFGQTITPPYSVRPRPFAPVSTPLEWSELTHGIDPTQFNIHNLFKRLEKKGDLFKPVLGKGINLAKCLKKIS